MAGPTPTTLTILALVPLIGWRLYVRVRRMLVRQRLSRIRPWLTLVIFPLLVSLLAASAFAPPHPQPERLAWLALGLVAGGAVAWLYGLKRTKFEAVAGEGGGLFYTHDRRLGIAISVLLVSRIVYRIGELLVVGPLPAEHANEFTLSPFTLGPVGVVAGYYMVYAVGLIRWRLRYLREREARKSKAAAPLTSSEP